MVVPDGTGGGVTSTETLQYGAVTRSVPGTTVTAKTPSMPGTYGKAVPGTKAGKANSSTPQSPAGAEGLAGSQQVQALVAGGYPDEKPRWNLINPRLHPLSETTFPYGHDGVSLQRGMLTRIADRAGVQEGKTLPAEKQYKFRFLYNPESISVSTAVDPGLAPPELSTSSGLVVGKFIGQETWRFGLMLDRTQEAYEKGIKTVGTLVDIDSLYRVINGNYGNPGFLYLSAIRVDWGPTSQGGRPLPPFNGYITSLNITHTKFTPRMCPIRSLVDISITRLVGDQAEGSNVQLVATGATS